MEFERISMKDGLISDDITWVFLDSKNYVWIGTPSGLSKYDGYTFTNYERKENDPTSLTSNRILQLMKIKTIFCGFKLLMD